MTPPEEPQTTDEAEATEEAAEPDTDGERRALVAALKAELSGDLVESEIRSGDVWVRVRRQAWRRAGEACRSMGFDYFCFLSGMDWMPSTAPSHKAAESSEVPDPDDKGQTMTVTDDDQAAVDPAVTDEVAGGEPGAWETGYAGGDTRFQVMARLYSVRQHLGVTLKADLDDEAPAVESWWEVYPGAEWHERETWEMFGFDFVGHPHLIHMYLPGEFEGFPLRKDFPLLAREVKPWPGLVDVEPMPEEAEPPADASDEAGSGEPVPEQAGETS